MYVGIIPFRLYNLSKFTISIGESITPIQFPLTNILELLSNCSGEHSNKMRIGVLILNHFIIGFPEEPLVINALIDICLCKPILPPSGVSIGSIYPHCEEFKRRGPTTFALASNGKLILRKCEIDVFQLKRFKS